MHSSIHSLGQTVTYIVEERLTDSPSKVNYAWMFDSSSEAIEHLVAMVKRYGINRTYTGYIHLQD